ncbi:MAG: hypothetical protein ABEJ82_00250 [Haloplanus sp.]
MSPFASTRVRALPVAPRLAAVAPRLVALVRAVSFWCAVALPFSVVALAATGGARPSAVAGLLAANAVALVVGHGHRADDVPRPADE